MVEIADIKDKDSLKAWLEDQPREVSVWIASRAAARALPVWWHAVLTEDWARKGDWTALPVLRSLLISSVAPHVPTDDIKHAAAHAASAAYAAAAHAADAAHASAAHAAHVSAAYAADAAAAHADAAHAAASAAYAAAHASAAADAAADAADADLAFADWTAVRTDAEEASQSQLTDALPLWPNGQNPLEKKWSEIKAQVAASPDAADWQFWIDWYDAQLSGRTLLSEPKRTWDMLEKIAVIAPETWDLGPEGVNPSIRRIWKTYQAEDQGPNHNTFHKILAKLEASEELQAHISSRVSQELDAKETELEASRAALAENQSRLKKLEGELEKMRSKASTEDERLNRLKAEAEDTHGKILDWMMDIQNQFDEKIKAATEALEQQNILKKPIELWKIKEDEHKAQKKTAYKHFILSLVSLAGLVIVSLVLMVGFNDYLSSFMAGPGCDSDTASESCSSFSVFGLLPLATVLTLVTLLLWFSRLKMKEYLSERHLMLDAREKQAFAEAYIQLVASGDSSDEVNDQRAIVYSALFRPSSDGLVKDDGGLDPSIAAAISKLLAR